MLVAEMMILAGEAVARLGAAASLPLPFRGQEAPQLPPEAVLSALPEGPCKGFALRKCMTRSVVSPQPVRHASLALDAYVQVTSPIRRYTDIIAHFNLKVCVCVSRNIGSMRGRQRGQAFIPEPSCLVGCVWVFLAALVVCVPVPQSVRVFACLLCACQGC